MEPGSDEYYMRMALAEAEKAAARDEVPVGAVVVAAVTGSAGTGRVAAITGSAGTGPVAAVTGSAGTGRVAAISGSAGTGPVAAVTGSAGTGPVAGGAGSAGSAGGVVIARAHNLTETLNDPTAHAEMQAITAATSYLGGKYLTGCTLYVTVEPCVMCAGALAWSQVSAVVWGADDPKKGYTTTGSAILHPKTVVRKGVLAEECSSVMRKFFRKKR